MNIEIIALETKLESKRTYPSFISDNIPRPTDTTIKEGAELKKKMRNLTKESCLT